MYKHPNEERFGLRKNEIYKHTNAMNIITYIVMALSAAKDQLSLEALTLTLINGGTN